MPDPIPPATRLQRSPLQKACIVVIVGLLGAALLAAFAFTLLELPPTKWINDIQDAVLGVHSGKAGFLVMLAAFGVPAIAIGAIFARLVRAHMARRGIPWVDDKGNVIP